MGILVEYADRSGEPQWQQQIILSWDYARFASTAETVPEHVYFSEIPLVFKSKFTGHGDMDHWMINGKSFPHTDTLDLKAGSMVWFALQERECGRPSFASASAHF